MRVSHLTNFDDLPRLDAPTLEWIAAFEGPSVAHLQIRSRASCAVIDTPEVSDTLAADWLESQEFPTHAFVNSSQDERKPAPKPACRSAAARAIRKFTSLGATKFNRAVSISSNPQLSAA
jgi:hypothetical protein